MSLYDRLHPQQEAKPQVAEWVRRALEGRLPAKVDSPVSARPVVPPMTGSRAHRGAETPRVA